MQPVSKGLYLGGYLVGWGMGIDMMIMGIALQRGPIRPRTTPGAAVGCLFIPFYNLYWIFQAVHGWTQDYNRYVQKANLDIPRMPEGLALGICIVHLCKIIPVVGYLMFLVDIILTAIFINFACDGINALVAAREYQRGDESQPGEDYRRGDERFSADNPFDR